MPIPSIAEDELLHVVGQLLFIKNEHPDAISKPAALALLKKSLARGRLFRSFDQGPPQRLHGQPPLKLGAEATANARCRLKLYSLLCTSVANLGLSKYPSHLWDSLYSAVPVALEWIYFLHPMNNNIRKIEDPEYNTDVASVFLNLLDGIVRPRIMKLSDKGLADWFKATHLDVLIVDYFVNLHRYIPDPSRETVDDTLCWMFLLCSKAAPNGELAFDVPPRVQEIVESSGYSSRRIHRAIFWFMKLVREQNWDYEESAHRLFFLAYTLVSEIPALLPVSDVVVANAIAEIKHAADSKAYIVAEGGFKFMYQLWDYASSYRVFEASISGGVFDLLVHLAKHLPVIPRTDGLRLLVRGFLQILSQSFMYWRPLSAFHLKHGPAIVETAAELNALGPHFVEFITTYQERSIFLEETRAKRLQSRNHCAACCVDKGGEGKCCQSPEAIKLLRCEQCHDVSYCSVECQKSHWRDTHRIDCEPLTGWCTARDKSLIVSITVAYLFTNARAFRAEFARIDPDRRYQCFAYLFFEAPRARLITQLVRECEPEEPCTFTVWGVLDQGQEKSAVNVATFNREDLDEDGWLTTRQPPAARPN